MLIILSPAKKQDFIRQFPEIDATQPTMKASVKNLLGSLTQLNQAQIANLMSISPKLAELNYQRFQDFNPSSYNRNNAKQAVLAFQGDVYQGLQADDFSENDFVFAQDHLRILSGLYGLLRPLDLIQPYRLEMKTPLKNSKGHNLYEFWGDKLTLAVNKILASHNTKVLINLASGEYFKAIPQTKLDGKLLTIQFKEKKGDDYKVIGIHAKKARGLMTRYIIKNKVKSVKKIQQFSESDYRFSAALSDENTFVFIR